MTSPGRSDVTVLDPRVVRGGTHYRWSSAVTPSLTIAPDSVVRVWTNDGLDGQIQHDTPDHRATRLDRSRIHALSGPIAVRGAMPGDCITVDLLDVEPDHYGFTHQRPGLGILQDVFSSPFIVHWRIDQGVAVSEQLPGIRLPGDPFLGVIGVAPSRSFEIDTAEREGVDLDDPPVGLPTGPPRANGGNIDLRMMRRGVSLHLPVMREGGLLSVGDAHFRQGDGEVCGAGIEMSAWSTIRVGLHSPTAHDGEPWIVEPPPHEPSAGRHSAPHMVWFPGYTRVGDGGKRSEDLLMAARRAVLRLIDWMNSNWGLRKEAAYALCSAACHLRIGQIVSEPYLSVVAGIDQNIFRSDDVNGH